MPASNPPRIVLHLGAPKTASTYLQRRLRADPIHLRKHGIHVPVLPAVAEMAGNAKLLATALSQRPSLTFQRVFPEIDVSALDPARLVAELLRDWRSDRESVVLSAENFRSNHARRLRELLPTSAPCVPVMFVRRQDRWIDSYFNQLVKTNEMNDAIGTFVGRLCDTEGERLCRPDWHAHYRAWSDAFGNCKVVFYDEVASDVFGAFLAAAGLDPVPDLIDIDPAQVSLDVYQLAYLLNLKTPIEFSDFIRRRSASEKASKRFGRQQTQSLLTTADLARLRERFEASNQRLMTALGRTADATLLRLDTSSDSDIYCDLGRVYASDNYARYRRLADAIYTRRSRRHHLKSLFKRLLFRES
jgi:hypothetical protein